MRARLLRRTLAAAAATALLAAPAAAQTPDARTLIDRHVAASGGRDAILATASAKATGTFGLPSAGLQGTMETWTSDGRTYSKITLPGLGTIESGFDGTVAWSVNPMQGPRILEGAERDQTVEQTAPLASVRDASLFRTVETVGRETIEGVECWKVRLVWNSGRESFDCYAVDTGLLYATISVTESAMGAIPTTVRMLDYQETAGVRTPRRMVSSAAGQEVVITVDRVEPGPQPDSVFALPEAIRALAAG